MADPRKTVDHSDIRPLALPFLIDGVSITYDKTLAGGSAQVGLAVNMSANDTIQTAGDGEVILGQLLKVEADGVASVNCGGVLTFKGGTGATLTPGSAIMGDLLVAAEGYIQTAPATSGGSLVARGMILDASDPNAVQVLFP